MRDRCYSTTNKYGKRVTLPPQTGNRGVRAITAILEECGIPYETEYKIDADGCRRSPFDVAVLKDGEPKLLIEYDGSDHYDRRFYEDTGVRPERCQAHVVKTAIGEAKKAAMAARFGIPLMRITELHKDGLRDRLLAWVEIFVNNVDVAQGNEVLMIDMLDRYGFDFPYIPPSDMTRKEKARVERLYAERSVPLGSAITDEGGQRNA